MPSKKLFRRRKSQNDTNARDYMRRFGDVEKNTTSIRLNFSWDLSRLMKVRQAAKRMDITLEAFLRFAAYERAIQILAEEVSAPIEYKRELEVISHKYQEYELKHLFRTDWVPLNWRWKTHALDIVKKAATATQCDYRTFIVFVAYEKAVEIAGSEAV